MVPSLQKTVLPVRKKRPPAQPIARAACFFCNFDCAVYPLPSFRLSGLSLTVISTARFIPYRHFDCAVYPLPSFRLREANGEISLSGLLFFGISRFSAVIFSSENILCRAIKPMLILPQKLHCPRSMPKIPRILPIILRAAAYRLTGGRRRGIIKTLIKGKKLCAAGRGRKNEQNRK